MERYSTPTDLGGGHTAAPRTISLVMGPLGSKPRAPARSLPLPREVKMETTLSTGALVNLSATLGLGGRGVTSVSTLEMNKLRPSG